MPQRFLRPGITNSDAWNAVSFGAQSFYIRILTLVDDYGRYDGRIPILHAHCFALRSDINPQDSAAFRSELVDVGLISIYTSDGKEFLQVTKWQERARGPSKFPAPPQDSAADRSGPLPIPASLAIVPSHRPEPSNISLSLGFAETPSWDEFWTYCQSQGLIAEFYAKDKFMAAEQDRWERKRNWRAYANRCKTWWEADGRPLVPAKSKAYDKSTVRNGSDRNAGTFNAKYDIEAAKRKVL